MSRTKQSLPEKYIPSTKDVEISLFYEYQWIGLLAGRGKPYDHIINGLLEIGKYWNSDESSHEHGKLTMKWFAERLNETPVHVNKWLHAIYDDLLDLNYNEPELFVAEGEIPCSFLLSGYSDGHFRLINFGVPVLPRVGESLNYIFARAAVGCDYFYVNEILYERELGKTKIEIVCKAGTRYNKYREFLLDKARFLDEIDFRTEYDARPHLDEMLQAYARKGHMPSSEVIQREREARFKRWRSGKE